MKAPIETLRLGASDRERLVRIKRHTGIESWNVICRWALLIGLASNARASSSGERRDAVEIKWGVLTGEHSDFYAGLVQLTFGTKKPGTQSISDFVHTRIEYGLQVLTRQVSKGQLGSFRELAELKSA